ncbi:unnamed protein product [Rotaria sp. Silwood2]|nr:unnamed protein product [Rotaria sp. Silwood2]CAF4310956.1 unnamed protein product [Rotaria sp. Silwood2]CAF4429817.1 unnamed protein product [Rotaria sp. Silwood2]CAF4551582.1 unnamed protein product [Rotaria sp. Silwood2]
MLSMKSNEIVDGPHIEVDEQLDQMNLCEPFTRSVYDYDIEQLAAVQQRAINPCHDFNVKTQSSTAKMKPITTLISQLNVGVENCQVLILTPTQESIQEIEKIVLTLGHHIDITCYVFINSKHARKNMKRLKVGVRIVVGTPGRVYDMLKRSVLHPQNIKLLILNETDKMLLHGFQNQIRNVSKIIPKNTQVIHLSATTPSDVIEVTTKFKKNSINILVENKLTLEDIRQFYVSVEQEEQKIYMLCEFYKTLRIKRATIFCQSIQKAKWLKKELRSRNFTVFAVYGNMNLIECHADMKEFRTDCSRILNTANSLTRITKVPQISLLINYDLPGKLEHNIDR